MNAKIRLLGAAALGLMVAACGTDPRERTTGGAAAGAATGAGIGALGGPPGVLAGAAIGGGVGAVTGAVTEPSDVNLGRPVWEDPETRVPGMRRSGSMASSSATRMNRDAQRALNQRGYEAGPEDGIWGARSQSAMREFQRSQGMEASGRLNQNTAQALNISGSSSQARGSMDGSATSSGSSMGRSDGMVGGGGAASPTTTGGTLGAGQVQQTPALPGPRDPSTTGGRNPSSSQN